MPMPWNYRIRNGAAREDALRAFREAVNQPDTMFSADRWLLPKLQQLNQLLHDPLTGEEAAALIEVLHERRWMKDLPAWLQGEPMSWSNFFVHRAFMEEIAEREDREGRKKMRGCLAKAAKEIDAKALASAKDIHMLKAKPCPRCGTPPENLEWLPSPRCSPPLANLCSPEGWKTRCASCLQEVDFVVFMHHGYQ